MDERPDRPRRALRLARQRGVQPRTGITPGRDGEELPGEPWRADKPRHRREQGQGSAVLRGRERVLLAAEPTRALCHHVEVIVLTVYSRPGCHLCDEMKAVVARVT